MNQVYRERFPRATANMEARLEQLHARLLDAISPSTAVSVNVNAPSSSASTFSSSTGAESGAAAAAAVAVGAEAPFGGAAGTVGMGTMGTTGSDGPARERECVSVSTETQREREASLESQLMEEAVKPAVDAVAHFMLQQLTNYVSECLRHSREHQLSSQYFIGLNEDISALINKAHVCPFVTQPNHLSSRAPDLIF